MLTFTVPFPGGIYGLGGILSLALIITFVLWVIMRVRTALSKLGLTQAGQLYVDKRVPHFLDTTKLAQMIRDELDLGLVVSVYRCGYSPKACREVGPDGRVLVITEELLRRTEPRPLSVRAEDLS